MQQNTELKHRLFETEKRKRELAYRISTTTNESVSTVSQLKDQSSELQKQVEMLQRREKELL
jgi:hypothetical protein